MSAPTERGLAGEAFVAIWHDIAPEGLTTFLDWHHREHMPERLAIPGFLRGRRYHRVGGDGQNYFNLYEVRDFAVLVGPDYLARLNAPTPWTQQAVPHFRSVTRGLCRVDSSTGIGQGGVVATVRLTPVGGREAELRERLLAAVPALLAHTGILGVHLGSTDAAGSRLPTAEKRARTSPTDIPAWVLLVEGSAEPLVRQAVNVALLVATLPSHGAETLPLIGYYQLEATRLNAPYAVG
jgi:hypothetical protein